MKANLKGIIRSKKARIVLFVFTIGMFIVASGAPGCIGGLC